ncbi:MULTISPECIES: hypothetical protein [Sphingobium]|uniref:Uncharacterized protein n=1 Tax=Sphingobium cupriresistens LL01 TaxID=1420583 RepID=A0A0J7XSH5_9SPHN|nr:MULTISPECIES: hypothetical protein [Sphingobium]KMS54599.1 hypothetical protein V473_15510 [Sphingobium cupriresistens LL01]MBJ7377403.1 hypothetical protein [Sphingobium sp.]WCP13023.1 hypothetical protein sphantq_01439 [Sphingobium sp. AntQ-1]
MSMLSLRHPKADPPIAWNDIEALPIYAAMLLGLICLGFALVDTTPTIHSATLKVVGIVGSLALRHAWLKLDDERGDAL